MPRPLRVAVVGAGPAGIYTADMLLKADRDFDVSIDLFERLPAPFGLVRYGVAPDHPRIKGIIAALEKILDRGDVRFFGNVEFGTDLKLDNLREFYDAVVFSTGCGRAAELDVPGIDLPGSFGAADFVNWYDGHPDVPRTWPLDAGSVAVIGAGNVALDVARILAKDADDLLATDIPDNVYQALRSSAVTDVHVFARRGPAQAKFTPLELRELGHLSGVDVIVYPEDFEFDEGSSAAVSASNQTKQVVRTLTNWTLNEPAGQPRRLHLHFLHAPTAVLGVDRVEGLRTERNRLTGDGSVTGTGEFHDWEVQAVYRAVGYFGSPLTDLPFDSRRGVIPNAAGRVLDLDGEPMSGVYTTGWIKRGPVGLIGNTKGDALETITNLIADRAGLAEPASPGEAAIIEYLDERGVEYTDWSGWRALDGYERALGASQVRDRVKVVPREEMLRVSRS